jgi:hypothetical protein
MTLIVGGINGLRHPGHGWQPFILPRKEAKALGEWLTTYVAETEGQTNLG